MNQFAKYLLTLLFLSSIGFEFTSCKKDKLTTDGSAKLSFSADSVLFEDVADLALVEFRDRDIGAGFVGKGAIHRLGGQVEIALAAGGKQDEHSPGGEFN